jgi:phosphatidylglycerophosphatase A
VLATLIWVVLGLLLPAEGSWLSIVTWMLAIGFTPIGTWATARLRPYWGDDPSRVVIDEMVGVWIPLAVLHPGEYAWAVTALVLFRFFDIVKPLGIKALDRRKGAFWVMGDDILGGIYALIVLVAARAIYTLTA